VSLHQYRILASVAKYGSETKAAHELHLSQPALCQHLKDLQERLGTLLTRNGHGIELTERGEALLDEITPLLAGIDSVEKKFSFKPGSDSEKAQPVLLGSSHAPATNILPAALWAFKRENPAVEIAFRVSNSPEIQDLVVNGDLDLAVISNPVPLKSLVMEPFKNFELCFFVSRDHPLAGAREISAKSLARYPLVIGRASKVRSRVDDVLGSIRANGAEVNVLMRCEWPDAVKSVVREGEAIGILYRDNIEQGVKAGQFRIINVRGINLSVVSYVVYRRDMALSQNAQEFLRFLRTTCRPNTPGKVLSQNAQSLVTILSAIPLGLFDLIAM
jgi:DNA-binding transcriptional LysR family regulator